MQITGEMIHEAYTLAMGSGQRWDGLTDASRDQYEAMAKILVTIIDREDTIREYAGDWLRDNPWMDPQSAHNLAEAGYQARLREARSA